MKIKLNEFIILVNLFIPNKASFNDVSKINDNVINKISDYINNYIKDNSSQFEKIYIK